MVFEGVTPSTARSSSAGSSAAASFASGPTTARRCDAAVDAIGHVPLPPYIKRDDRASDRERYQTVFARARGSIAAPTAGLHFTAPLLAALARSAASTIAEITLHVGYGTFQPVRVERVEDHRLEPERYEIQRAAAATINARSTKAAA